MPRPGTIAPDNDGGLGVAAAPAAMAARPTGNGPSAAPGIASLAKYFR
jgi:hypothetical protein